jgi:excisionase family DNA binding protein
LTIHERKLEAIGLSVVEAARAAGVGRSTLYGALAKGELQARKLGTRTIILEADLRVWLASLPAMKPTAA